ncbi:hypothetical protein PR048_001676 [Dryococelus australis]|uniref:RNA-directed DNA polymerase n=1 Tax=Dryococelus australis TaxID=614101 RepID=A0ABQ9IIQ7_9NEOP|nr:hypothetical protein PR048_001676 [Dryococelus australis]
MFGNRVVIPCNLRQKISNLFHEQHPGMLHMKILARSYMRWPKMNKEIENNVRLCEACQLVNFKHISRVIENLRTCFIVFGLPGEIVSDNDPPPSPAQAICFLGVHKIVCIQWH